MNWQSLAERLERTLHLATSPLAITFSGSEPAGVELFDEPLADTAEDGRTGGVPAGCVFWMKATDRTFTTVAQDHANCSVGSYTHGFLTFEEMAARPDTGTLLESGWVTAEAASQIPQIDTRPGAITYGPLADTPVDPDVVLLRINARQLMVLSDALPDLRIEGKPQCHIVAIAQRGEPAASVGCALSRVRTGMQSAEMTCALPASRLGEICDTLEATDATDDTVMAYAAADARRF